MNQNNTKSIKSRLNRFTEKLSEELIIDILKKKANTAEKIAEIKRSFAKKRKINCPGNPSLISAYRKLAEDKKISKNKTIEELLKIHKIRTLSGVAVVAALTKPAGCPGRCVYCPTEKNLPKSYLAKEPAVMRAVLNKFDPFRQVKTRLETLKITGHETDKIELIIIGGTFSALPENYRIWFVKRCFDACNTKKSKIKNQKSKKQSELQNLKKIQKLNEKAKHRIVGITVETRPDYISEREIKFLRQLGTTRVELGVQSICDEILGLCNRGHNTEQTIKATKFLKDSGFKIGYHMMPNLPGSAPAKDLRMFKELFKNPDFRPDLLKIYPTVVTKNTILYKWWKKRKYKPYSDKILIKLLLEIKKRIPPYVRISRLIRDIPSTDILGGSKISNLRQILDVESKKQGWGCQCVRCREIKEFERGKLKIESLKMIRQDYRASGGKEIFLSFEDPKKDKLAALLRLRLPSQIFTKEKHFMPILQNAAIIREIHTYGRLVPISKRIKGAGQHSGLGKRLINEAERIAREEFGIKKIAVISGAGARDYYRKLGYRLKNEYMVKKLN